MPVSSFREQANLKARTFQGSRSKRLLFADVETTGLFSSDRIVSLGLIAVESKELSIGTYTARSTHLIFDPGKKSHPRAEEVHGFDDWTLRHQDSFSDQIENIRPLFLDNPCIVAHNADFDRRFIEREFELAGSPLPRLHYFCTMRAYREKASGRAGLNAVLEQIGLSRIGKTHGAFEDAWMAMQVYLWLHGLPRATGELPAMAPINFRTPPPRPDGPLPRRSRKRKTLGSITTKPNSKVEAFARQFAEPARLLLYLARCDGLVDSEIAILNEFVEAKAQIGEAALSPSERMDLIASLMDLTTDDASVDASVKSIATDRNAASSLLPWLRATAYADGQITSAERQAISTITNAFRHYLAPIQPST